MRRFWSYGPIDKNEHYYADRKELIETAYSRLTGENPQKGGHYITVWAPRQTGKSWAMIQIYQRLLKDDRFDVVPVSLEHLKDETDVKEKYKKTFKEQDTGVKVKPVFVATGN